MIDLSLWYETHQQHMNTPGSWYMYLLSALTWVLSSFTQKWGQGSKFCLIAFMQILISWPFSVFSAFHSLGWWIYSHFFVDLKPRHLPTWSLLWIVCSRCSQLPWPSDGDRIHVQIDHVILDQAEAKRRGPHHRIRHQDRVRSQRRSC